MKTNLFTNLLNWILGKGANEEQGANHALITQLSRTNHPINLHCSRYAAVLFMVFVVGIGQAWADNVTISAAEMVAGDTKSHITPDAGAEAVVSEQQVWLDGSTKKKYDCLQLSSASGTGDVLSAVKEKSVFFSVDNGYKITGFTVSGASNKDASTTAPIVMVCWTGDVSRTPALIALITLPHRQTSSLPSIVASSIPAGTKTIALYRQVKVDNTTTPTELVSSSGSNYGSGNTGNIVSVTITYEAAVTPPTRDTLSYDANGGTGSIPSHEFISGTTVYAGWNSSITRDGYVFDKWNTQANGEGTSYYPYESFTLSANTTLYAQWKTVTTTSYTISLYNLNVSSYTDYFTWWKNDEQVLDLAIPDYQTGYEKYNYWVGKNGTWKSGGSDENKLGNKKDSKSANAEFLNMPLTASYTTKLGTSAQGILGRIHIYDNSTIDNLDPQFTPRQWVVMWGAPETDWTTTKMYPSGGENEWVSEPVTLTSTQISDWEFYAGFLKSDGGGASLWHSNTQDLNTMGVYNKATESWRASNVNASDAGTTGIFRLFSNNDNNNWDCHWAPCYVLHYDVNSGSGSYSDIVTLQEGDASARTYYVSSVEPTRNGYSFEGWNTSSIGNGDSYAAGDAITLSEDVTLYAQWECVDPTITTDLSEDQVDYYVGASATALTVAATAAGGSVSYQWYSNDEKNTTTPTTLTTGASYIPSTAAAGTTYYYCVVTNSTAGCSTTTTSSFAKIVVSRKNPTKYDFTATSASICSGEDATFTLAGSQVGATYYITKNNDGGDAIDTKAGTGSSLTFTATSADDDDYYCYTTETTAFNAMKVSNSKATISYKTATSVTVDDATLDDAVVDEEYTISGITGAGAGTLYYQWYSYSDDEGSDETEIVGADADTYAFTPDTEGDYYFKCEVTGDCGSVKSSMITVTATVATYTVTYNKNNGSATGTVPSDASSPYDSGSRVVVKSPGDLALEDHIFVGWNDKSDGSGNYYSEQSNFAISENKTLYAQWRDASGTTCPDGSSEGTVFSLIMDNTATADSLYHGESRYLSSYATITNGAASFTNVGTTPSAKQKAYITKATKSSSRQLYLNGNDAMITLYLDCALAEGDTIKFTSSADKQLSFTTTPTYDNSIGTSSKYYVIPAESSLIGKHTIYLWRKTANGNGIQTITIIRPVAATYTVTYKANGGTGDDVEDDAATSVASNTFTAPTGKVFGGWNTKSDGTGTPYAVGDAVSSDLTLYAQWKYKILYLTSASTTGDDLYDALKSIYDVTVRAPRTADITYDYGDTALVVLHESMSGDTHSASTVEVGKIKTANIPILNTKSYFYGADENEKKRWKWGAPNAGQKPQCIHVKNDIYANVTSHPIFADLTPDGSDSIQILESVHSDGKPIQPIGSFVSGKEGYTLATVPNKLSGNGTAIHELTPTQRGASSGKYLLISVYSKDLKNLNANGVKLFQNAANYLITGSQWVPQYAITKSATYGSVATEVSSSAVTSAAAGTRVDITATPSEGYVFSSWSVYKTGDAETTISTNAETSPTYFTMPAYPVTVSATFALDGHSVTYANGGATSGGVPTDDNVYAEGATVTVLGNTGSLAKTEHSFGGWTANVNLTINDATVTAGTTIAAGAEFEMPDEDVTLTAVWTPNTYDITYNLNSGSWASSAGASSYTYGVGYTLPTGADITRTNYTFIGWYDNEEFDGSAITAIAADATGDQEYWAKWGASHSITWKVNGAEYTTGTPTTTTCQELGITTMPTAPSALSCSDSFRGWSGTNLYGDAVAVAPADLFVTAADAPSITKDTVFYAIFADNAAVDETSFTSTFTSKAWADSDSKWTSLQDGGQLTTNRGIQVTTSNNDAKAITKSEYKAVTKVVVTYSTNSDAGAGSIEIKVGGTAVSGSADVTKTGGTEDRTINYIPASSLDGKVQIYVNCTTNSIYIKSVQIYHSGSFENYRCLCPTMTVTPQLVTDGAPIFITSAANKTVRSQDSLRIVGSGLSKSTALTLSSPASKFVLKSRTNGTLRTDATGAIDTVAYIFYTPGEGDTRDGLDNNANFTVSVAGNGAKDVTVSQALIGRHLPENFVIAVKKNSKWWALPANHTNGTPAPIEIEVDNDDNPTKGLYTDSTHTYSMSENVGKITTGNGQYVRLGMHGISPTGGSGYAPLFGSTDNKFGQSGTSTMTGDLGQGYWWQFTQKNTSTISSIADVYYYMSSPNNNTGNYRVRLFTNDGEKWGQYTGGSDTIRLLWAPDVYAVYCFTEGGTINSGNITKHTYSVSEELPTDITRTGYTFDGWYAGSSDYAKGPYTHIPADTIPYIGTGIPTLYFHPKWTLISGNKCEEADRDFITAYTAGLSEGASTINDVKYSFDGYDAAASVLSIASGSDESYIYLNPKMGDIKEVELYFSEIGAGNGDANTEGKGISYGFSDSDEADFDASAVSLTDKDKINRGTLSFRPASDGMQYFVFKPYGTSLKISNICVFYDAKTYSVTYAKGDGADGTAPSDATVYKYNELVTAADTVGTNLVKDGYTFRGWSDNTAYMFYQVGDQFTIAGNTTLTAVWQSNSGGGGSGTVAIFDGTIHTSGSNTSGLPYTRNVEHTDVTTGLKYTLDDIKDALINPSMTNNTGNGKTYAKYIQWGGGTGSDNYIEIKVPTGSTADLYIVSGASGGASSIGVSATKGAADTYHELAYKSWSSSGTLDAQEVSDLSAGTYYINGKSDKLVIAELKVTITGGASNDTIAFADGTSVVPTKHDEWPANIIGVPRGSYILPPADPIAVGYAFLGWYKDAACSEEIKLDTFVVRGNKTIYAKWVENVKYFTGAASTDAWETAGNWVNSEKPSSTYPYCYAQVYVMKPVKLAKGTKAHVGHVDIVKSGTYESVSCEGSVTIADSAMLIIYDSIAAIATWEAPTTRTTTTKDDLRIKSSETYGNGALIMANYTGYNEATVEFATKAYSKIYGSSFDERDVNQYFGIPFDSLSRKSFGEGIFTYYYEKWDNSWWPMSETEKIYPFLGYDIINTASEKKTFELEGKLVPTADKNLHLRSYEGWYGADYNENLLANSWTAPIDIRQFELSDFTNAEATIYMFNAGTASEFDAFGIDGAAWSGNSAGQYTAVPLNDIKWHPYAYARYTTIPSMQSFSIVTMDDDGNSYTHHDNAYLYLDYKRLVYDAAVERGKIEPMHAPRRTADASDDVIALSLKVRGASGLGDHLRILEHETFTDGFDNGWEASKLLGIIEAPSLFAASSSCELAVVAVPEMEGMVLTFQAGENDDNYIFSFEYPDDAEALYLLDLETNTYTRISAQNTYSFTTTNKNFNERFVLTHNAPQSPTGLDNSGYVNDTKDVDKVLIEDLIYIRRGGEMYSIDGRMVK